MNILVICGSARKNSRTERITQYVGKALQEKNVKVTYFDVGQQKLPLMDGEAANYQNENVLQLQKLAQEADGFYIATPEYHNGMSGSLKNALDFLNFDFFANKPVGIAAAAGGGKGGMNALNNLRFVLRGVGSLVLTNQAVLDPADILNETELSESAQGRLNKGIEELISYTEWNIANSK